MAKVTQFKIELEQEEDGRWIGEVPSLPGVMAYGHATGRDIAETVDEVLQIALIDTARPAKTRPLQRGEVRVGGER